VAYAFIASRETVWFWISSTAFFRRSLSCCSLLTSLSLLSLKVLILDKFFFKLHSFLVMCKFEFFHLMQMSLLVEGDCFIEFFLQLLVLDLKLYFHLLFVDFLYLLGFFLYSLAMASLMFSRVTSNSVILDFAASSAPATSWTNTMFTPEKALSVEVACIALSFRSGPTFHLILLLGASWITSNFPLFLFRCYFLDFSCLVACSSNHPQQLLCLQNQVLHK
jgi:hypothetical protein